MSQKAPTFMPLYLIIFLAEVGYSMSYVLFTVLLLGGDSTLLPHGTSLEVRTLALSVTLFMYPAGQFLGAPILGALSDYFGRKKLLLSSLTLAVLTYTAVATSLTLHSFYLLLGSLFLAGFFEGNIAVAQSAIGDVVAHEARSKHFGAISTAASLAWVVGPVAGGVLSNNTLVSWFSPSTPFWMLIPLLGLALVWTAWRFHETRQRGPDAKLEPLKALTNLKTVVTNKRLRPLYWSNFIAFLAAYGYFRAFPIYAIEAFDIDATTISMMVAYITVPLVIANSWAIPHLAKHFSMLQLCTYSSVLMGLFTIAIVIPTSPHAFWITLFPAAFCLAVAMTSLTTLISQSALPHEQGQVMGNNQGLRVGAEALTSISAGPLALVTVATPFIAYGAIGLLAGALFYLLCAPARKAAKALA